MSLKTFHLIFLLAALVLSAGFAWWCLRRYLLPGGTALDLLLAMVSVGAGLALVLYSRSFVERARSVNRYLR